MEIVKGVHLHLIKKESLKTVHIKCRFSGQLSEKTVAKRVLVAQMLETATKTYPDNQSFRIALAKLYGATLSTNVLTKGQTHCIDIDASVMSDDYCFEEESLLTGLLDILRDVLFAPLISTEQYQKETFELEKQNLIAAVASESEDIFHVADLGLKKIFYQELSQSLSRLTSEELLVAEDAFTAYQEYQRLLEKDRIDIFIVGPIDEYAVIQQLHQFPFSERQVNLNLNYQQPYRNIISESFASTENQQSVLMLGYQIPFVYDSSKMVALALYNALLGELPTSKLFVNVREKQGLAYAVGSYYDDFSQLFTIYAGIQRENKNEALKLILKQVREMRLGKFRQDILEKAKLVLKNQLYMALDSPEQLIEIAYRKSLSNTEFSVDTLLTEVDNVSKDDVIQVAKSLRLQATHLLEGS